MRQQLEVEVQLVQKQVAEVQLVGKQLKVGLQLVWEQLAGKQEARKLVGVLPVREQPVG